MSKTSDTKPAYTLGGRRGRPLIGMFTPVISTIMGEQWRGALHVAQQHELNLLCLAGDRLRPPEEFHAQANILYELVTRETVDGLIIATVDIGTFLQHEEVSAFCRRYFPLPIINIGAPLDGISGVFLDNYQGIRQIMAHLIEQHGYRQIAFIRGPQTHVGARERYRAYTDAFIEYGLTPHPSLVPLPLDDWNDDVTSRIDSLLGNAPSGVDSIVAASDDIGLRVMQVLRNRGLRVPEDIAVTGFDNRFAGRASIPSLTTVKPPHYELGQLAMEMISASLRGEDISDHKMLPTSVIIRQSCGCPYQSVVRASTRAIRPPSFESTPDTLREQIVAGMATFFKDRQEGRHWMENLLDAFERDLQSSEPHPPTFMTTFQSLLLQNRDTLQDGTIWQNVLSEMRCWVLPSIDTSDMRLRAEDLWQQARVLIGRTVEQCQEARILENETLSITLRRISNRLLSTFDMRELLDILAEELPRLNISRCYLALYVSPETPGEKLRLVLAYDKRGRLDVESVPEVYPSSFIVPEVVRQADEQFPLLVEPLYFRERQIGLIAVSGEVQSRKVYDALQAEISCAIQGALLVRQVREHDENLERVNAELKDFAYIVSHDLKAPLRGIASLAYWLSSDYRQCLDAKGLEMFDLLTGRVKHMDRLIDGILHYSRVGRIFHDDEPTDIQRLVSDVIVSIMPPEHIHVFCKNPLPTIRCDRTRIMQIFQNLISNAVKFMDKPRGEITIDCRNDGDCWTFTIRDNGPGIEKKHHERIFQIFQTAHSFDSVESTGIGLALVKKILDTMGGRIWLESTPGMGSVFFFTFPKMPNDNV